MFERALTAALGATLLIIGTVTAPLGAQPASQSNAAAAVPGISGHFMLKTPEGRALTDRSFPGKWLLVYLAILSAPTPVPPR